MQDLDPQEGIDSFSQIADLATVVYLDNPQVPITRTKTGQIVFGAENLPFLVYLAHSLLMNSKARTEIKAVKELRFKNPYLAAMVSQAMHGCGESDVRRELLLRLGYKEKRGGLVRIPESTEVSVAA